MRITNTEQVVWDFEDGPRTVYIATVEYQDGDEVPGLCEWLVPDMTDGVPDVALCEAYISGPRCAAGHPQVAGTPPLNEPAELN